MLSAKQAVVAGCLALAGLVTGGALVAVSGGGGDGRPSDAVFHEASTSTTTTAGSEVPAEDGPVDSAEWLAAVGDEPPPGWDDPQPGEYWTCNDDSDAPPYPTHWYNEHRFSCLEMVVWVRTPDGLDTYVTDALGGTEPGTNRAVLHSGANTYDLIPLPEGTGHARPYAGWEHFESGGGAGACVVTTGDDRLWEFELLDDRRELVHRVRPADPDGPCPPPRTYEVGKVWKTDNCYELPRDMWHQLYEAKAHDCWLIATDRYGFGWAWGGILDGAGGGKLSIKSTTSASRLFPEGNVTVYDVTMERVCFHTSNGDQAFIMEPDAPGAYEDRYRDDAAAAGCPPSGL